MHPDIVVALKRSEHKGVKHVKIHEWQAGEHGEMYLSTNTYDFEDAALCAVTDGTTRTARFKQMKKAIASFDPLEGEVILIPDTTGNFSYSWHRHVPYHVTMDDGFILQYHQQEEAAKALGISRTKLIRAFSGEKVSSWRTRLWVESLLRRLTVHQEA